MRVSYKNKQPWTPLGDCELLDDVLLEVDDVFQRPVSN